MTAGLRLETVEVELSGYGQYVDDYIYFSPELNTQGLPRFDVTIRGTYPSYEFRPIDAIFYGSDGTLNLGPRLPDGSDRTRWFRSRLRSRDRRRARRHPCGLPAADSDWSPATDGTCSQYLSAGFHRPRRIPVSRSDDADFVPSPDGYALLGAGIEAEIGKRQPVRVGIEAHNLLNTAYRDYTSLLRFYADQPGRDIRLRVGMDFNPSQTKPKLSTKKENHHESKHNVLLPSSRLMVACCRRRERCRRHHGHDHDHEAISKVILDITSQADGSEQTINFTDPQTGDGGTDADIELVNGTTYDMAMTVLNDLEDPIEDITLEIIDEQNEHQVFFTGSAIDDGSSPSPTRTRTTTVSRSVSTTHSLALPLALASWSHAATHG